MAQKVVLTSGISGSGKSTFLRNFFKGTVICPDDIRRELTGNVSDQSRNAEVWELTYKRFREALATGDNVAISAMFLNEKAVNSVCEEIDKTDSFPVLEIVLMEDSYNWKLCADRVKKDIENGVDRADTASVNGLIETMHDRWVKFADNILNIYHKWAYLHTVSSVTIKTFDGKSLTTIGK